MDINSKKVEFINLNTNKDEIVNFFNRGIVKDLDKVQDDIYTIENEIEELRKKLKEFRQSGLESGGEYSYENLVFKLLRRNGYIEKLLNLKNSQIDKKLSVAQ